MTVGLLEFLAALPEGPIENVSQLESYLMAEWDDVEGGGVESTDSSKLQGRIEHPRWEPPLLRFVLERHGRTVNGSGRAELHHWCVNVSTGVAQIEKEGIRQLRPTASNLDVVAIADEIVELVRNKTDDPRLQWRSSGSVKVLVATIIPDVGPSETVAGRRKRFRRALREALVPIGWQETSVHIYRQEAS